MKSKLKYTLMTLTILSTSFFVFSSGMAQAGYRRPKAKPAAAAEGSFKQYPKLGEVKDEVNLALSLHQTAVSLLADKKQLQEYKDSIAKYDEIKRRLQQNMECNVSLLNENFSNGDEIWKKIAAYAEDTSSVLLAEASNSLGDAEASKELSNLEKNVDSGNSSASSSSTSSSDSKYAAINENTSQEAAMAMVAADSQSAEDAASSSDSEMNVDEAAMFGKIRWDVGFSILKDLYTHPDRWGSLKKRFSPWADQKYTYDVYVKNHYAEIESHYVANPLKPFPTRPKMAKSDSYLPEDLYTGEVPDIKASSAAYNEKKATVDDKWCGQTDGKKNKCVRVDKGNLYKKHQEYVKAFKGYQLKENHDAPEFNAPYLPQKPLPPWRESVYITSVEKQIPEIASELPDPWYKVTQSIENFTNNGELAKLVERHGNSVRYRPSDYDSETLEVRNDANGLPRIPIPLMTNRIGAYLTLMAAEEDQKPVKERAIASIKEMNENILATFSKAGYTMPDAASFDLSKESDYNMALEKMGELQNAKIAAAKAKMADLKASFGADLLPSIQKVLAEETVAMDALQKDTEFLINVTRDNAKEINSLLLTAVADATANENYKSNLSDQMEDAAKIPAVGCPVL